ncbi:MAG: hypothetical protein N3H31_01740 [Candidatus Nezhaarchaeota archaeon]|nr:hypothetical protein [Candidatus Nezhaarchaeota archaeon]
MLEEVGLLVTYITMGLAPITYNFFLAKRALLKKRPGGSAGLKEGEEKKIGQEAKSFTLTIPCGVGPVLLTNDHGDAVYLGVNSVSTSYIIHVKRVLSQG